MKIKETTWRFMLWASTFCFWALFCMNLKDALHDLKEIDDALVKIQ